MYPYVLILIGLNSIYKQTGWFVSKCPYCQTFEAMRVEQRFLIISLLIRLAKVSREKTLRCDFCERLLGSVPNAHIISIDEWDREDGIRLLFRRVLPDLDIPPLNGFSETRIRSLLDSVAETTSLTKMHVSTTALTIGGLLSLPISIAFAIFLHNKGYWHGDLDKFGFVALCGIVGFVIGAILGGGIYGIHHARKVVLNRIFSAHSRYDMDMQRFEELSRDYPQKIRNLVSQVCQEMLLQSNQ
jgi:phage FluMu protein Com